MHTDQAVQDLQSGMATFAALRGQGEWVDAVRAMLDRAAGSPDSLKRDLFLAMAETFQSEFPSKGVDTELQRIQISRLLVDAISAFGDPSSHKVAKLLIALSRKAGDHDRVIEFGRFLSQHYPKYKNDGDQAVGQALFNKKRHEEALAVLTSVEPRHRNRATVQIMERLETAGRTSQAHDLFEGAFALADNGTDPQAAREMLGRALELVLPSLAPQALSRTLDVMAGRETAAGPAAAEAADRNIPIFCGGFRWSGASAVYDFLADQTAVTEFWRRPRFMQGSRSSFDALSRAFRGDAAGITAAARAFFIDHVVGVPKGSSAKALKTFEAALLRQMEPGADLEAVDAALADFFKALGEQGRLQPEARQFPGTAFASALRAFTALANPQGRRFVLFDSVIRASRADLLDHVPGARMVAVLRDPRDMYVTHVERGNWTKGVERYIEELKELLSEFDGARSNPAVAQACRVVRFEEFVTSESVRRGLLAWLGIDNAGPGRIRRLLSWLRTGNESLDRMIAGRFVAEQSAQNIGVYRHFADQDAIRAIEESFPDLCKDIALPAAAPRQTPVAAPASDGVRVVTFSPMASRRQQQDQMGLAGKPGEPGWARRREITVNLLAAGAYDFIGLQHCYLDKKPPYNAVGYFQDSLAERGLTYGIINHPIARDATTGDSTPLYYRLDRWDLDPTDHGVVWFETPPPPPSAPGGGGLLFVYGLFHERTADGARTGRRLYVYNTRLRDKHTDELDLYRARCFVELTRHIAGRDARDVPVILLADTNTKVVDSLADRVMRGEEVEAAGETLRPHRRMQDALVVLHPGLHGKVRTQHNFRRPGDTQGKERNDRVMFSGDLDVADCEIMTTNEDGLFPSYHYPVQAMFKLGKGT